MRIIASGKFFLLYIYSDFISNQSVVRKHFFLFSFFCPHCELTLEPSTNPLTYSNLLPLEPGLKGICGVEVCGMFVVYVEDFVFNTLPDDIFPSVNASFKESHPTMM